jgi:opacity protein-like surface antigen
MRWPFTGNGISAEGSIMMKRLLLTTASLLALAAAPLAQAADLAPVSRAPAPVPVYNWTGLYLGVQSTSRTNSDRRGGVTRPLRFARWWRAS